jgi:hypothetical protein
MIRKALAWVTLVSLFASPAFGFDTYWHQQASKQVGAEFGFSEDAWKIMQLGNFAPDLFGPVSQYASNHLKGKELEQVSSYVEQNGAVRAVAVLLHFDNLGSALDRNSKFDSLVTHLLQSTQATLASFYKNNAVDERTRKTLILVTLGASLHAVQDFYSHSDWVHQDFDKTKVKMVQLPSGGRRAPTWFEFRSQAGDPDHWPFQLNSGIYPPVTDVPNTHSHMNHDNSLLTYREYETAGQPVKSEASYHNAGPVPAHEGDNASIQAHQQLAVDTAIAASTEWVRKIEENQDAKAAIEWAKGWNVKTKDPKLVKELEAGRITEMALSCAAGRWDGENPPADRGALCKSVLEKKLGSGDLGSASQIEADVIGLLSGLAMPLALKFTGKFWDVYPQYHVLEQLTKDIGTGAGQYTFGK